VTDTGCGMTPEVKAKAFEPFFTTKEIGQGSGLGLSQVYEFVRQSKGHLELITEPGKGSAIKIYLPKSSGIPLPEKVQPTPALVSKRGTVLVVEDDPDVLEVATMALQRFGYNVYSAKDGFAALAILRQQLPIDLLFTDVVMPNGMNGVDLAQNARRMHPAIRVLLASGNSREALQIHEGLKESMSFLPKPYSLSVLAERLSSIIH
jgi:CheY-like chemotaxis protein